MKNKNMALLYCILETRNNGRCHFTSHWRTGFIPSSGSDVKNPDGEVLLNRLRSKTSNSAPANDWHHSNTRAIMTIVHYCSRCPPNSAGDIIWKIHWWRLETSRRLLKHVRGLRSPPGHLYLILTITKIQTSTHTRKQTSSSLTLRGEHLWKHKQLQLKSLLQA